LENYKVLSSLPEFRCTSAALHTNATLGTILDMYIYRRKLGIQRAFFSFPALFCGASLDQSNNLDCQSQSVTSFCTVAVEVLGDRSAEIRALINSNT